MSTSAFPLATDPHFINAFYLGLLAVAAVHRVSPLSAPGRAALLPPPLFDAPRGVRWLARLSSLRINAVLRTVRAVTVALWAWCCVAQSEAAAVPRIGVLIGVCVLQSSSRACCGSHSWHVAIGILLALCFDGTAPALGGFGRVLALGVVAHALFSSGVMKLRAAGVAWARGDTLRFYLRLFASRRTSRCPALTEILARAPLAAPILACSTLALELSAPLGLASPALRAPYLATAAAFHFGVWLTMKPAYFAQAWCYALLVAPSIADDVEGGGVAEESPPGAVATRRCALALGTALGAALLWTTVRAQDGWLFSCYPMYAARIEPARGRMLPHSRLALLAKLKREPATCEEGWCANWAAILLSESGAGGKRLDLQRLLDQPAPPWYNLATNRAAGAAMLRRAHRVARIVEREYHPLLACIACNHAGGGGGSGEDGSGDAEVVQLLQRWEEWLQERAAPYDAISLVVRTEMEGVITVCTLALRKSSAVRDAPRKQY
jgi:hypothetical protein